MNRERNTTLYCFSPPVMLATFTIETGLFIYTLLRYKMSTLTRLIATTLALLAIFQLAEYYVCHVGGTTVSLSSRLGYMAITLLPITGIHLISTLAGRGKKSLIWLAYTSGAAFALIFGLSSSAFSSHVCAGNYAIFQLSGHLGGIYFAYYYFWLLLGICMALYFSISASKKVSEALVYQVFGYLSLLLPTGIVNALHPESIDGIPSIMCGFAVIYALILTFGIAPVAAENKKGVII
jgi:uncharacterized membrane protein YhaH (DUF805 family)